MDRAQLFALVDGILPSHHPRWQLRGVMLALLALGHPRRTLEGDLSAYAARLREEGREEDWDVIAEASDFLNGWAGASSIPE